MSIRANAEVLKTLGDVEGHEFHGNQYGAHQATHDKGVAHGEMGYGFQKADAGRKGSEQHKAYSAGYHKGVDNSRSPKLEQHYKDRAETATKRADNAEARATTAPSTANRNDASHAHLDAVDRHQEAAKRADLLGDKTSHSYHNSRADAHAAKAYSLLPKRK